MREGGRKRPDENGILRNSIPESESIDAPQVPKILTFIKEKIMTLQMYALHSSILTIIF